MNSQRRESSMQRFGNVPAGRLNNSVQSFISKLQENNGAVESVYCDVAGNVFNPKDSDRSHDFDLSLDFLRRVSIISPLKLLIKELL